MCTYNSTYTGQLVQDLFNVNYLQPPYSTAFPSVTDCLTFRPCVPVNITIEGTTYCNTKTFISTSEYTSWNDTVVNNVEKC